MRESKIERNTNETKIKLSLNIDKRGESDINTGIGFLDHMLELFAFHSGVTLNLKSEGDLNVDSHHSVEDIGIVLGKAILECIGDAKGINRYGSFNLPMDESLCNVTLDFSGRPYLVFNAEIKDEKTGEFDTTLTKEFFNAISVNSKMTLHINVFYGDNAHHIIEAIFKGFGRALKEAMKVTGSDIESTKGILF